MSRLAASCTALALVLSAASAHGAGLVRTERLRTIVVDPGHGGENLGALAVSEVYEKVLTLELSLRIERLLKERTDAQVYLTRRDDRAVGLRERTRFANQVQADVFLSIHCNSQEGHEANGVETFFLSAEASDEEAARLVAFENERLAGAAEPVPSEDREVALLLKDLALHGAQKDSQPLAELVLRHIVQETGGKSRGVRQAPFAVLMEAEMPALVVEVGFVSNPREAYELLQADRQEAIARAIVEALIEFDRQTRYR